MLSLASRWLRYLLGSLQANQFADYFDMGLGIEARSERLHKEWSHHLEKSKLFQRSALQLSNFKGDIALLGAGRCLDLDTQSLLGRATKINWYDLDRTALKRAKSALKLFDASFACVDLTASICDWTALLRASNASDPTSLAQLITNLEPCAIEQISVANADCLISLNTLGQIPLYWRDRVGKINELDQDWKGNFSEPVQASLLESMQKLQVQHLKLLAKRTRSLIILICDFELIYQVQEKELLRERALLVNPEQYFANDWKLILQDQWMWDIAPQGKEQKDYGCQHSIKAWAWQKIDA